MTQEFLRQIVRHELEHGRTHGSGVIFYMCAECGHIDTVPEPYTVFETETETEAETNVFRKMKKTRMVPKITECQNCALKKR